MQKGALLSIIIAFIGLLILSLYLLLPINVKNINSPNEINSLEINQKVFVKGEVIKQTTSTIRLNNNLLIYCSSCPSYSNKTISILGRITDFYTNKTIEALKITIK